MTCPFLLVRVTLDRFVHPHFELGIEVHARLANKNAILFVHHVVLVVVRHGVILFPEQNIKRVLSCFCPVQVIRHKVFIAKEIPIEALANTLTLFEVLHRVEGKSHGAINMLELRKVDFLEFVGGLLCLPAPIIAFIFEAIRRVGSN